MWVKKTLSKLKTSLNIKDVLSFLLFLLLSSAFWFVHTLDRERQNVLSVPIEYTGMPEEIEVTNKLPSKIKVTIRDEGVKLLQYSRRKLDPMNIDLKRVYFSKGKIIITPDQLKSRISKYLLQSTAVLSIEPDSLVIVYRKLSSKDLPIKIGSTLQLAQQHMLSDSIRIEPSKIKVFGPKHVLDTMKAVYTESISQKNISDTMSIQQKLKRVKNVKFTFDDVNIGIFVEMFTENKVDLPITVINNPENLNIRTFPVSVTATYNIGLSNFKKVNVGDIKIVFDYKDVENAQKRKNKLRIINNSPYIYNLRINPEEVEYLLEKK